ncbi:hypothetical protein [Bradyrhizobium liaoningense]|uniref:hypothetical protein n=1 Tax=Bradyrhizobium liaoningense TaxID=43992 RepID=UPI001BAD5E31|nr:hypothetical protein [Bradyrhizobium liaoningense]MBR0856675.1 hypothetical protein [Bradyrhizobium liaoningense]
MNKLHVIFPSKSRDACLTILLCIQIAVQCSNLYAVARSKFIDSTLGTVKFDAAGYHLFYDPANLSTAILCVGSLMPILILFFRVRISFGYIVALNLYLMALGYMWLNSFSDLKYDHALYGASIAASTFLFVVPALFISSPIEQKIAFAWPSFHATLNCILLIAAITVSVGAYYNFKLVGVSSIYEFRNQLAFPKLFQYLLSINGSVLLPFAFAGFLERRMAWGAIASLLLLLLLYPITLSKMTLFAPAWLIFIALLATFFEARISIILSLLLPTLAGLLAVPFIAWESYFLVVNFRMMAIPSVALDLYSHYFSSHSPTYFCQIWLIKPFVPCSYHYPLSVVMEETYHLGFFNASLLATEGIASVGPYLSPLAALACALIIGLGNRLSAGLPPRLILTSSAVVVQALLNVPLSTVLLTHGLAILYLLWYVTPRDETAGRSTCAAHA